MLWAGGRLGRRGLGTEGLGAEGRGHEQGRVEDGPGLGMHHAPVAVGAAVEVLRFRVGLVQQRVDEVGHLWHGEARALRSHLSQPGPQVRLVDPVHQLLVGPQDADRQHVGDDHDEERNVEGEYRAVDNEVLEHGDAHPVVVDDGGVHEAVDTDGAGDGHRHDPDEEDLEHDHGLGLVAAVAHGVLEGEVAVHGHGAHVPDGGSAHQHVAGHPHHAHLRLQREVACNTASKSGL